MVTNQLMLALEEHGIKKVRFQLTPSSSDTLMIVLEYAAKAKAKDQEEKDIMQQKEEQIRKGIQGI